MLRPYWKTTENALLFLANLSVFHHKNSLMDTCAAAMVTARNSAAMPRELLESLFASIPPPKKVHVHTFTFTNKSSFHYFAKEKCKILPLNCALPVLYDIWRSIFEYFVWNLGFNILGKEYRYWFIWCPPLLKMPFWLFFIFQGCEEEKANL